MVSTIGIDKAGRRECLPLCSTEDTYPIGREQIAHCLSPGVLHGSLPRRVVAASLKETEPGKRFRLLDRELDKAAYGPTWLKDPRLAKVVVDALHHGAEQLQLYRLSAYVVMSNHVHILIWPKGLLPQITKSIKGFTAGEANLLLVRTGEKFWQEESFDHAVRSEDEFCPIASYIERKSGQSRTG